MNHLKLKLTEDGSYTLFNESINEHFHSIHGAVQESNHVFIETGLKFITSKKSEINILEIGFGTGLNALLTLINQQKLGLHIEYTAIEPYPLPDTITQQLNYCTFLGFTNLQPMFEAMHSIKSGELINPERGFAFMKILTTFQEYNAENRKFDLVYFDAFSPEIAPDLWTTEIFKKLKSIMNSGGILVTYCSKGVIRRTMQSNHFTTERLAGPPGKREMLRATAI